MTKLKSEFSVFRNQLSLPLIIFVYATRIILLAACFFAPSSATFSIAAFLLTYIISFSHLISKENTFLKKLNHRITVLICFASLISSFIGKSLGVLDSFPDYDIIMSAITGVTGTLFGYYTTLALTDIKEKRDCGFVASSSFFICGSLVFFREMFEFLSDWILGTNYVHAEHIGDDHWFFRVFGLGSNIPEQRPLYDTDEDMLISLVCSAFTTTFIYIFLFVKNKNIFVKAEKKILSLKAIPSRIVDKVYYEIEKVKEETNIYDILTWWLTRAAMIYAAILMENPMEKILVIANLIATFAISLIHFIFPKESLFCKINYRMQSWLCLIVFTGSYMGNFIFVYNHLPRFDLFLHFISGPIAIAGGYYVAKTFMKLDNKHNIILAVIYAFCLSCFVMPFWEVFEFLGDFLFGSANQGFYWTPSDNSFFFKVFGRGTGNTTLYYLFDTVYDVLLALVTTVISVIWLYISLIKNMKNHKKLSESTNVQSEKITVNC